MSEQIRVEPQKIIESLSRQVAQQAQRIAFLEAIIEQTSIGQDDAVSSGND